MTTKPLIDAIRSREQEYERFIYILRDAAESDPQTFDATTALREALELVRCLRRLVGERTVTEIHAAFGAPGDFGYDTPIGDALALIYRGGS